MTLFDNTVESVQELLNVYIAPLRTGVPDAMLQDWCTFRQFELGQVPMFGNPPVYLPVLTIRAQQDIEPGTNAETITIKAFHKLAVKLHGVLGSLLQRKQLEFKTINNPLTAETIEALLKEHRDYDSLLVSDRFQRALFNDPTEQISTVFAPTVKLLPFYQGHVGKFSEPSVDDGPFVDIFTDAQCYETLKFVLTDVAYFYKRSALRYFRLGEGPSVEICAAALKISLDVAFAIETNDVICWRWWT